MVEKFCSKSHGHPVPGVRNAAMMAINVATSRDGVIGGFSLDGQRQTDRTTGGRVPAPHGIGGLGTTASGNLAPWDTIRIRDIMEYL